MTPKQYSEAIISLQSPCHSVSSLYQNSSLSTLLQSHPVELSWAGLSDTLLLYCGTVCHLIFAVLKTVAGRIQISYPNLHFCQNSRLISFTCPILAPPNLHLPLLHQDPTHRTWQIHGHLTNISALIIKLTSNDLDSIGYLSRLPFLLYCVTLRYLYVRASNKTLLSLLRKFGRPIDYPKFLCFSCQVVYDNTEVN